MRAGASGVRPPVLMIHGGLAEGIDADQFWVRPGIVGALRELGVEVTAPDRDTTPRTWSNAAADMAALIDGPATIVAASNGVSVALRLAVDRPDLVVNLVLLWPATAGDAVVDAAVPAAARHLLSGDTVRGATDAELRALRIPVAVMASEPENRSHQHRTVDRLVALTPGAIRTAEGFPEAPRPEFTARLDAFVAVLVNHL